MIRILGTLDLHIRRIVFRSRKILFMGLLLTTSIILILCLAISAQGLIVLPKLIIVPDNYGTISEAVSHAGLGDVIYVRKGVYRESIIIDKPIVLLGENTRDVIIDGNKSSYTFIVKSGNVIIVGFTIMGGGVKEGIAGMGAGIEVHGVSNVILANNHFVNNRMAIYIHSSRNVIVYRNTLYQNREAIYLTKSSNVMISKNSIVDNPAFGIHTFTSRSNKMTRNIIIGSIYGIHLYNNSDGNEISENLINGGGMLVINSSYNTIMKNTIFGKGLLLTFSSKNTIIENSVNGKPLIYLEEADGEIIKEAGQVILMNCNNVTLKGLEISGVSVGIELWGTNNTRLLDSSLSKNEVAVYMYSSHNNEVAGSSITSNSIGVFVFSSSNNEVYENLIDSNLYGVVLMESWSNKIMNNTIAHNLNYGILSINSPVNEVYGNLFLENFGENFYPLDEGMASNWRS